LKGEKTNSSTGGQAGGGGGEAGVKRVPSSKRVLEEIGLQRKRKQEVGKKSPERKREDVRYPQENAFRFRPASKMGHLGGVQQKPREKEKERGKRREGASARRSARIFPTCRQTVEGKGKMPY